MRVPVLIRVTYFCFCSFLALLLACQDRNVPAPDTLKQNGGVEVGFVFGNSEVRKETSGTFWTMTKQQIQPTGRDSIGAYLLIVDSWDEVAMEGLSRPARERSERNLEWVVGGGFALRSTAVLPCTYPYAETCIESYIDPQHRFRLVGYTSGLEIDPESGSVERSHIVVEARSKQTQINEEEDGLFAFYEATTTQDIRLQNADTNRMFIAGAFRFTAESWKQGKGSYELLWIYGDSVRLKGSDAKMKCDEDTTTDCVQLFEDPDIQWNIFALIPMSTITESGQIENSGKRVELGSARYQAIQPAGRRRDERWELTTTLPVYLEGANPNDIHLLVAREKESRTGDAAQRVLAWIEGNRGKIVFRSFSDTPTDPKHSATLVGILQFERIE